MASDIFSLRIVDVSHYMNRPVYGLDSCFSEFRGKEIKSVPVIRIFGSTSDGIKTCLHIHGVLPYFYIPYEYAGKESLDKFIYELCESLDKALNVSLGQSSSQTHHIFNVQLVKAFPFYGYHRKEHLFLKIYMYNPRLLKRASNLLQNGALQGKSFQAFDSHVPYRLQFLIDYNLFPMSFLRASFSDVKFRETEEMPVSFYKQQFLDKKIQKVSTSKLEVDICASSILNRIELEHEIAAGKTSINPGIESIWQDEEIRRKLIKMNNKVELPVLEIPKPDERLNVKPTSSELFYRSALERKLSELSCQITESNSDNISFLSSQSCSPLEKKRKFNVTRLLKNSVYPDECPIDDDLLNATIVQNHLKQSKSRKLQHYTNDTEVLNKDVFDEETLNEQEIINLSQHHYKNFSFNDTSTCEQGVLDFIKQLEEEDKEERGIDLDSSLGPFSESQQNYNKEVLEFLRQLSDEDENIQDQINNLSQKFQSDSEDECLNNYTVANEDIEEILTKLSQTVKCTSVNADHNFLPQVDGADSTPKKNCHTKLSKTPSPTKLSPRVSRCINNDDQNERLYEVKGHSHVKRSPKTPRTPRSIKYDRYKPLQGITIYSPNKSKICENDSDLEAVSASSAEMNKSNRSILRRKKRKYSFRERRQRKSYYEGSLISDDVTSLTSRDSSISEFKSDLDKTEIKVTCNLKTPKNKTPQNKLRTQDCQTESRNSEIVQEILCKNAKRNENKNSENMGTKMMRSRLRKRIDSIISNSEVDIEKCKSSENQSIEGKSKINDKSKNDANSINMRRQNQDFNIVESASITGKPVAQPHVLANLQELGLCFLEEKNSEKNKLRRENNINNGKNYFEEKCKILNENRQEEERSLAKKIFKTKRCKVKSKRLKIKEMKSISKKEAINADVKSSSKLNAKENSKTSNVGDCIQSDIEEDLNICSFYDVSFFVNSPSMFSDADSPIPKNHGEISQTSDKKSKKSKRRSISMSPLQFSDEDIDTDINYENKQNKLNTEKVRIKNSKEKNDESLEDTPNLPIYTAPEIINQMPFYSNPNDVRKGKEVGHLVLHIPLQIHETDCNAEVDSNKIKDSHKNNVEETEFAENMPDVYDDSPIKIRRQKISTILIKNDNEIFRKKDVASLGSRTNFKKCKVALKKISLNKLQNNISLQHDNKIKCKKKLFCGHSDPKENKRNILNDSSSRTLFDDKISSSKSNESFINGVPIEIILSDEVSVEDALTFKSQNLNKQKENQIVSSNPRKSLKRNASIISETSFGLSGASLDNTYGFKARLENLQQAKADIDHYYLTTMSLEIFVKARGNLLPNPAFDEICGVFYAILNDVPENHKIPTKLSGYILVAQADDKNPKMTGIEGNVTIANSELQLFNLLLELIRFWDPDILAGYEIEMSSWGYILDRSKHLNINYIQSLSRVPSQKVYENVEEDEPKESYTDLDHESKIYGRILLDVWRLLRSEIALTSYSFENVMYHILHRRIPSHCYQKLTEWYFSAQTKWIVLEYYLERVNGVMDLLDQLDLIGRTCEMAKLIGIQFYEILSRGSQYRVESMMLRIAKPKNLIPMSPSPQQRLHMRAPEYLPLILEPQSRFYADPLIVLDFQSLYPSIMIAYNYCFSTCLGRVEHLGSSTPFEFGVSMLKVSTNMLRKLLAYDMVTISPCGVAFVKQAIREGVLPQMVREILDTRLMVKQSMKLHKSNEILQRVLHSRQLALKLMANVTYGYTAANFSGRMPCVEVGDSVVAKGRETLERAIKLVEATPRWGAEVVYGDTDSLFILCPGKTRQTAFKIGEEIAEAVTKDNPFPVKLKLEKIYQPSILQTKKRYVGYMYETPDQVEPIYEAKGIETVRRDGCPAVVKILEKSLKILFQTKDVSQVKLYVCRQFTKILQGKANVQDLIFAKEFRGRFGYKPGACVPALELTRKWMITDPRKEPRRGERVPYIVTNGPPGVPIIRLIRCPHDVLNDEGFKINAIYYITKAIIPALNRCFLLIGADVNEWFAELPRKNTNLLQHIKNSKDHSKFATKEKKTTISQYFSSTNCVIDCGKQTKNEICNDCAKNVQNCVITLQNKISKLERAYFLTEKICQSCVGRSKNIDCKSLDCPVLFVKEVKRREYKQIGYFKELIDKIS
ncbi:DNA polymerase zeta catalytic subunit [Condylostylus longicornis]|uniref:DNA polymerase zeta catalytic subunit n=1 Tax=Condylostylus longicornis TaxID=2530218 RepID=UPI00244DFEB7|nr:DNA polymerase zeta catalytic subunit [Condylostylus longicornis]